MCTRVPLQTDARAGSRMLAIIKRARNGPLLSRMKVNGGRERDPTWSIIVDFFPAEYHRSVFPLSRAFFDAIIACLMVISH